MKTRLWVLVVAVVGCVMFSGRLVPADDLEIKSFDATGRLMFSTLNDGTNYNYQVEWAPSVAGPWIPFNGGGAAMGNTVAEPGSIVTSTVPMCYRVVATLGDYMVVDLSSGTNGTQYPVKHYRTLADVPGGANSDTYKTTNLLMRLIPKGMYIMGSPTNELGRQNADTPGDETLHQVTLSQDFYIGVFEVTQRQWERVMGTWPSHFSNPGCRDSRPVEQVSYDLIRGTSDGADWPYDSDVDTYSFMGRLRERTGKKFDLPTESQWEYAGRAMTTAALNSGYNLISTNSDDLHMSEVGRCWYNGGSNFNESVDISGGTAKVGSYLPNHWGLYDFHGNVSEWCLDWYGPCPGNVSDPRGAFPPSSGRVNRGGEWSAQDVSQCRMARRVDDWSGEADGCWGLGFRASCP